MKKQIRFYKIKNLGLIISGTLLAIGIIAAIIRGGFNIGIDFTGGVKLTTKFASQVSITEIRNVLNKNGISSGVQSFNAAELNEYIITAKLVDGENVNERLLEVKNVLVENFPGVKIYNQETVGPTMGSYLLADGIKLFCISLVLMLIYLAFRFEFKYAIGAVVATIHDLILCFFFCGVFNIEFSTSVMAAMLTVFGYSFNDTIVIFDRIRENSKSKKADDIVTETVEGALNQSLSRTVVTSLTTLISVLILLLVGGDVLTPFAAVLTFGVIIGTYSSIYIAPAFLLMNQKRQNKKAGKRKQVKANA